VDTNYEIQPDEIEILIVEDSPTQAERLRRLIQSMRYGARVAANGRWRWTRSANASRTWCCPIS
jgi:two-component system sensor histidine kinase/response regulator